MNYDTKGVILKTNANGDSLWMRQYNNYVYGSSPTHYQETFFGVEKTLDGGYILCGNVINQPKAKAWVVKTDSLGCIYNGCGSVITGDSNSELRTPNFEHFSIYPNPANDFVIIKPAVYTEEKCLVTIADVTGKVLVKQTYFKDEKLGLKELSSGIYLVNLYVKDQIISTKKLVIIK
jgi:hypothetical protein